ncbi:MAG TPA: hypothetical protein PKK33_11255, partial [Candidatus Cloacimonadota bacterium]|nr:hypothetical protein [Candidatus Cloacimonadota bacterium]
MFIKEIIEGHGEFTFNPNEKIIFREMKEWNSRNLDQPLSDIKDLDNDLLTSSKTLNVDQARNEESVNKLYHSVLNAKDNKISIAGIDHDFSKEIKHDLESQNGGETTKERIRKEIIPLYSGLKEERDSRLLSWLNPGTDNGKGKTDDDTMKKFFKREDGVTLFNRKTLRDFKTLLGINWNEEVIRYSQLATRYPELTSSFNEAFKGQDPWIIIHKIGKDQNNKDVLDISLFDVSYSSLRYRPTQTTGNTNILANYIDDVTAKNLGIRMNNSLLSTRKLQMGLTALKIAEQNPNVNIRRIGAISLRYDNAYGFFTDINEVVNNIKGMSKVADFMARLPKPVQEIVEKTASITRDYSPDYFRMLSNIMTENLEYLESIGKESEVLSAQLRTLQEYMDTANPTVDQKKTLIQMLRTRQHYLENVKSIDTLEMKEASVEYRAISSMINELKGFDRDPLEHNRNKKANWFQYLTQNLSNVANEIEQNLYGIVTDAIQKINGIFIRDFKTGLKDAYDKINKAYFEGGNKALLKAKGLVVDDSEKRFENLWIWSDEDSSMDIRDEDGNKVNVNLRRIHWD